MHLKNCACSPGDQVSDSAGIPRDNLASLDMELSTEQLKCLDGASRIEPGFPQSIYDREMVRAIRYGGTWDRLQL
jgi:hypothetical protein